MAEQEIITIIIIQPLPFCCKLFREVRISGHGAHRSTQNDEIYIFHSKSWVGFFDFEGEKVLPGGFGRPTAALNHGITSTV